MANDARSVATEALILIEHVMEETRDDAVKTSVAFGAIQTLFASRDAPTSEELEGLLSRFVDDKTFEGLFLCLPWEHDQHIEQARELESCLTLVATMWCKQRFVPGALPYGSKELYSDVEAEEAFDHLSAIISKAFGSLKFLDIIDTIDKTNLSPFENERVLNMCTAFKKAVEVVFKVVIQRFIDHAAKSQK